MRWEKALGKSQDFGFSIVTFSPVLILCPTFRNRHLSTSGCGLCNILMLWKWCICGWLLQDPEDEEEENFKILPSDNLLIVGRADDEYSCIEVHGEP